MGYYCILLNNEGNNNDAVVELINDAKGQWHEHVIISRAGAGVVDGAELLAVDLIQAALKLLRYVCTFEAYNCDSCRV